MGVLMKLHALAAFAALGIMLSGCASVVKGSTQSVAITTPPIEGATCTLTNPKGETWTVVSPGIATIGRSKHDLQVKCVKVGYRDGFAVLSSSFEGWTLGNLFIGGIIGFGVDAATGAINEYPHAFQVPMTPGVSSGTTDPQPPTLQPGQVPAKDPNAPWPATPAEPANKPTS